MSKDVNIRYSDSDLAEFKKLINEKIDKAKHDLELIKSAYMNDHNNGTDDTSPTFKAFEEGSATMSKESNSALAIRQEKFIRDLLEWVGRLFVSRHKNNCIIILVKDSSFYLLQDRDGAWNTVEFDE